MSAPAADVCEPFIRPHQTAAGPPLAESTLGRPGAQVRMPARLC